jgi:hypothetical protein
MVRGRQGHNVAPQEASHPYALSLATFGVLLEMVRAGTPESKVRVWSRSLDPIDFIG